MANSMELIRLHFPGSKKVAKTVYITDTIGGTSLGMFMSTYGWTDRQTATLNASRRVTHMVENQLSKKEIARERLPDL